MQFSVSELSNRLFRSSAARSECRPFPVHRGLSDPRTKRDGEPSLHVSLHFGAAFVSDELRATSLHTGTIAEYPALKRDGLHSRGYLCELV
jgi:hypothetical protein